MPQIVERRSIAMPCALRTIQITLLLAGIGYGQEAQAYNTCAASPPLSTCGLVLVPAGNGYNFIAGEQFAFVNGLSPLFSIYMDNRSLSQTQNLTVSGTDMTNFYVNGSFGGTAVISLVNGARTDLISAGNIGRLTNVNIIVNNSTLNGAQTDFIYDFDVSGNKNFVLGSAIYIDPLDVGNHTIDVVNGSQLHGSIVTGGGTERVTVDSSTIDRGGIYVLGIGRNSVSVSNSTVDATNSQVAANLAALDPRFAAAGIDDLAIGLLGGVAGVQSNTLSLAGSTVIGDVGLLALAPNSTNNISVIGGSRIEAIWFIVN